jgi:hypothetical protein
MAETVELKQTGEPKQKKGLLSGLRSFNGVDIVTIGVLAVLFRVAGMPLYRITEGVFPYNIGLRFMIDTFLAVLAVLLVRKKGTLFAYVLVWWLINLTLEGEDLVWLIGMWFPMIAGEWYLSTRPVYGGKLKDILIGAGLAYGFFFAVVYWVYLIVFYKLIYPVPVIAISLVICLVGVLVGPYLGFLFGTRIKPLLE